VILLEPASFKSNLPRELAIRCREALSEDFKAGLLPSCYFAIMEVDIQRSLSECGIFSLSFAKKAFIEKGKLF